MALGQSRHIYVTIEHREVPMNYIEQEIIVHTADDALPGIPISVGGPLLNQLERTVRPCVRMALTGRSTNVGQQPQWLKAAWDFRALGFEHRENETVLHISAPRLVDAAPQFFEQQTLWDEGVRQSETALNLFGRLVGDVKEQASGSNAYDDPLLKRLADWSKLLQTKVKSVGLPTTTFVSPVTEFDSSVVGAARALSSRIPPPRQVRLVGTIDMVRWSTRSMAIKVEDGSEYRCTVINDELGDLGQYGGRELTVIGRAIYRPSGSVLRLDVQQILDTTVGRDAHSSIPSSFDGQLAADRRRQTEKNGVSAVFGIWPGSESDEELLEALAGLRR